MIELRAPRVVGLLPLQKRVDAGFDLHDRRFLHGERATGRDELLPLLIDERRRQQVRVTRDQLQRLSGLTGARELRGLRAHAPLRELLHACKNGAVWRNRTQLVQFRALAVEIRKRGLRAGERSETAFQGAPASSNLLGAHRPLYLVTQIREGVVL